MTDETVGGWVMAELGRVPEVGDVVDLDGWQVTVTDMDTRRVDRLRFVRQAPAEGDASSDERGTKGGELQ
ncbi:transporter associated domain-containing protein [Janibacter sp. G368]|uniref:transporter associated domain-containing protein n=1 Tax=Janibacter sp. G368 TaxID=3420441 RepID=UPI003D030BA9